jgi:hydrogenase-4 component E
MAGIKSIIAALILLTSFIFLMQNRINSMIATFTWQSILLACATFCEAYTLGAKDLYISMLLTILLKVIFLPMLLTYLVHKLNIRHKVATTKYRFLLLLIALALVLFCYRTITPISGILWDSKENLIVIAMSVMLLGMSLLITHSKAISHVIGFLAMENGIFFAALVATHGMPMVVELGIAFDVLIAAVLFGIFFLHLRKNIDSLDVDKLNLLREDIE